MAVSLTDPAVVALALGVLSHVLIYVRVQPKRSAVNIALFWTLYPSVLFLVLNRYAGVSVSEAAAKAAWWSTLYTAGTIMSMVTYRIFLHPLRAYPGPFWARVTQWSYVWKVRGLDAHHQMEQLAAKYGEFVRTGPNYLMITDPDIVQVVHGSNTKFTKSDFYFTNTGYEAVHNMVDHEQHDLRRTFGWDEAFTAQNLRDYDGILLKHVGRLMDQFQKHSGQRINATDWLGYFAFDFIGDLGYGRDFEALKKGTAHWYMTKLRGHGMPVGWLSSLPWLIEIILSLPIPDSINGLIAMLNYSYELAKPDPNSKAVHKTIMARILEAGQFHKDKLMEERLIAADSRLLVIAGSDTTSGTLSHVFYHLAKYPEAVKKLRKELEDAALPADAPSSRVAQLSYLNAVIYETMRLFPVVPGGTWRAPPKEGINFKDHFIPGGCVVITPQQVIQRSPKAFKKPNEFIPERWTTQPGLIIDRTAHFPFGIGRYGCVGKQLAYNEMRCLISRTVLQFDIKLADGENGDRLVKESKDFFTLGTGPLDIVLTARDL